MHKCDCKRDIPCDMHLRAGRGAYYERIEGGGKKNKRRHKV